MGAVYFLLGLIVIVLYVVGWSRLSKRTRAERAQWKANRRKGQGS